MLQGEQISEVEAIAAVDRALSSLQDDAARDRVLAWANSKYGHRQALAAVTPTVLEPRESAVAVTTHHELPAPAQLWLRRNGIPQDERLARVFSIDQAQIDIVADEVPGESTKARMRNVFLLRGACGYLSSADFRFSDELARSTCGHYRAYDPSNYSNYVRSMSDEVSGSKDSGYTLTARGQRAAADLLKSLIGR